MDKGFFIYLFSTLGLVLSVHYVLQWRQQPPNELAKKTVLVLMVKNEAAVIKRILLSAKGVLANYLILCDTGSDDLTEAIAYSIWVPERYLGNDPYRMTHRNFDNFTNFEDMRNKCNAFALDILTHHWTQPGIEWIALADADFTVVPRTLQKPEYDVNTIQIHASTFGQVHNSLNMLISARVFGDCHYRLWTHEYLECKRGTIGHYSGFYYVDHADGKSRPEKLVRDIRLLNEWLLHSEANGDKDADLKPRALYYLGRAHEDNNNLEVALDTYERHDKVQTFTNYLFYAKYREALIHLKLNHSHATVEAAFLQAHATHDGYFRREPLYYLTRLWRTKGDANMCILYGTAGMHAPPIDHSRMPLFLETNLHEWAIDEEVGYCLEAKQRNDLALSLYKSILERNPTSLDPGSRDRIQKSIKRLSV